MKEILELTPVMDKKTGKYVVEKFDEAKQIVENFIQDTLKATAIIENDIQLKGAKLARTDIRKKKDVIQKARIDINSLILGQFNSQLKEIEGMLGDCDKTLKDKIDAYAIENDSMVARPKLQSLIFKSYDLKTLEKILEYGKNLGIKGEIK